MRSDMKKKMDCVVGDGRVLRQKNGAFDFSPLDGAMSNIRTSLKKLEKTRHKYKKKMSQN